MAAVLSSDVSDYGDIDDWALDVLEFDFDEDFKENIRNQNTVYPIERLTAGSSITIEGRILDNCNRFIVNLICEEDIALHINPRFDQNYIARNAKINKAWGPEESQLQQKIPFTRGEVFIAEILVAPMEYMVSINGVHIFSFAHRLHFSEVKTVEISSDVVVTKFFVAQLNVYPSTLLSPAELPIKDKTRCPIVAKLGTMQVGDIIELIARVNALPHSFYLNLQAGFHAVPHPIIPYHIVVRYMTSWQVAQNSWSGGRWHEEISEKLPSSLLPGETFRLLITCLSNGFSANVNSRALQMLPHRASLRYINTIFIIGDLTVLSLKSSTGR